jgi:ribonuclease BN (tRNA processing enzyme)
MKLIITGSGTGYPYARRRSPGLYFEIGGERMLIDCGPGAVRSLAEFGIDFMDIDRIVFTHFHLDHISDFGAFLFASKYHEAPRKRDLTVWGPPGTHDMYRKFIDLYGSQIEPVDFTLTVEESDSTDGDGWNARRLKGTHTAESRMYRFEDTRGGSLVVTGDCEFHADLVAFAHSSDILVAECSLPYEVKGHLTPESVALLAHEAEVDCLVLVHLYPPCDRENILPGIRHTYGGRVLIGEDGLSIDGSDLASL